MGEWRECTLGDLITIKHGYAFRGEYFGEKGTHVVLTPGNFFEEGGFKEKPEKAKWYSGPIPSEYILKEGDLIIAMTEQAEGLLGSSAIIPQSDIYLHNQRLGLIKILDPEKAETLFLYYLFNTPHVRQQIRASASGAKIRHTAPSRVAAVKVLLPPLPLQRCIASILSAYDELIENNRRRIRILEEMARSLYREWFVNFRFPGHEKVRMVKSELGEIPEGWKVRKLGDVVALNYGRALKQDKRCNGDVSVYGSSGVVGFHNEALVKGPGIILGRKGNVGSVYWCDTDFFVIDTAYYVTSQLPLRYVYHMLPGLNFINGDAAVPGLSRNQAYALHVLVPPPVFLEKFSVFAEDIGRQVCWLELQTANLRRTRDLLLPRLMSGQIDLS